MAWSDQLGRVTIEGRRLIGASFRGVPFLVEDDEQTGGRRAPTHEFPGRDKPYKEDLGRKAKTLRIVGYVLGENYLSQKEKLINALEGFSGPGDLRSPYNGKHKMICDAFSVTETRREGGIARFAMEFGETSSRLPFPSGIIDKVEAVKQSVNKATIALQEAAANVEDFGGLSGDFLQPAEDLVAAAGAAMRAPFSALTQTAEDLAAIRRRIDRLVEDAANLVRIPLDSLDAVLAALAFAFRPPELPSAFADLLASMDAIDFVSLPTPPSLTPRRELERDLFELTAKQTRRAILLRVSSLAAESKIPVLSHALKVRDSLLRKLDRELDEETSPILWATIGDVHTAITNAIPSFTNQRQEIANYTPPTSLPSLVVAHKLYGNTRNELDLVAQNAVQNPFALIGGQSLEYITNDS